ncbi:MAG: glycogen/starch synthase [Bacteroidales bacterium]|nr:glycogen/starch synthase [Bacteroidales bacterium]MDD7724066.1 glycogen/starch synthase [Bacteroidales bacterium]MDY4174081.1 glycogen/starch synthase [Bacteroidales bacterium]
MESSKILYISQEIKPYLPDSPVATLSRDLSQGIMEGGKEIRTFMPRFGSVNERRNQLHEVIRLSGLNIAIDDTDHPLLIKVASIQAVRMQIYFIDNDDLFGRKGTTTDVATGAFFEDNDERSIFFARGSLETTKKLRWVPDLIHLHGWFTMMTPIYTRLMAKKDPYFAKSKIVVSLYDDAWEGEWKNMNRKLWVEGIDEKALKKIKISDYATLMKTAIDLSDGVTVCSATASPELIEYAKASGKPVLEYQGEENYVAAFNDFYDKILGA